MSIKLFHYRFPGFCLADDQLMSHIDCSDGMFLEVRVGSGELIYRIALPKKLRHYFKVSPLKAVMEDPRMGSFAERHPSPGRREPAGAFLSLGFLGLLSQKSGRWSLVSISGQIGHPIPSKSNTHSDANRPPLRGFVVYASPASCSCGWPPANHSDASRSPCHRW